MEIRHAKHIFTEYMRVREVCAPYRDSDDPSKFIVWDRLFKVWGEGATPLEAADDLNYALKDYFDAVLDSSEDVIDSDVELSMNVIDPKREGSPCLQAIDL